MELVIFQDREDMGLARLIASRFCLQGSSLVYAIEVKSPRVLNSLHALDFPLKGLDK